MNSRAIRGIITVLLCLLAFPMMVTADNVAGIDTGLQGDDEGLNNLPIGFTFVYWGVEYTTFGVSINGWISLKNTASGTFFNPDFPMDGDLNGLIAPFFDDIRTDVSGQPEGKILYSTIGEEPNRQLVIQYHDMYFYGSNLPMGTFEAILYEGTNQIKFQYRYLRDERSYGNSATIGMDHPELDEYIRYSYSCLPELSYNCPDYATSTSTLEQEQAVLFKPDGQGGYTMDTDAPYSWIDITGLTSLPPEDEGEYASSGITFTWEPTAGANAYLIDISTTSDQSGIIKSFPLENVTTFTYSENLTEGTKYYARVAASLNYGGTYQNPSLFSDGIIIDKTPPVVNKPTASRGTQETTVDFHFSGTDNYVITSYHIQIASDAEFTNPLVDTTVEDTRYSYQSSVGQVLYARAYATDGAGNKSDYSDLAGPFNVPVPMLVPQSDATTTTIPIVDGDGIFCEIFLGVGGGKAPQLADIAGVDPDADLLSPHIDFPHPGNTVAIGQNFQNFFSDTIYAPDAVRDLQPRNFILRGTALLKITQALDKTPETPEIDIGIRLGSDDGFYMMVGNQYLGEYGDRAFNWSAFEVPFEGRGLYPLYFLFAANSVGYSGLELQWQTGAADWVAIPQSHLYPLVGKCDEKIFFEEHPAGTLLTNQYANQGVIFNVLSGNLQITNAFPQDFVPVSGDRVFGDPSSPSAEQGRLELLFVDQETGQPAVTNYFSCFLLDTEEIGAKLTAYNPGGQEIHSVTVNAGGATQDQAEINMPGIRRLEITLGQGNDTSALDNLCWAKPTAITLQDAPVITYPSFGTSVLDTEITVRGNAESGAVVEIFVNDVSQGTATATSSGHFSLPGVQLSTGENSITAVSTNSYGVTSSVSEALVVSLVPRPQSPGGLAVTPGDTVATLIWNSNSEPDIQGYYVYRDDVRLNYNPMTDTTLKDTRLTNGKTYKYTVTAVNANEIESHQSSAVMVTPVPGAGW